MMRACSLFTFLSFFVHSTELTKLPNDILYVIFTNIQKEETLNQRNSSNFSKYLRLPLDINYYVCPSPLVYVNTFFSSFFQEKKLLLTRDYLEQNILDEIVWIQRKHNLFFPLEKLTCFFSDIQHGAKSAIQCTINNLASAYAEKYSKNNQLIWKNKYTEAKTAYKAIPHKFVDMTVGSLQEIISTTNTDIETTAQNIYGRKTELANLWTIPNFDFFYIKKDVNEALIGEEHKFNTQKTKLAELELTLQKATIFTSTIENILTIHDKDSFRKAFIKLKSKNSQINFNVKEHKKSLLKLIAIQIFTPYCNSEIHKNIAFGVMNSNTNLYDDTLEKKIEEIYLSNTIYHALWPDQENFKSNILFYIQTIVRPNNDTHLFFPFFLIQNGILELNLTTKETFDYYKHFYKAHFLYPQNIHGIHFTVNDDSLHRALDLMKNLSPNIKINWEFVNLSYIQNNHLILNENYMGNKLIEKLNSLYHTNNMAYQSIMNTIKKVDFRSNMFMYDNTIKATLPSFINKLPAAVQIKYDYLIKLIESKSIDMSSLDQFFNIFITRLLKEKNDFLVIHKDLLPIFTYIKKEKYTSFFKHINTIICHISDKKELMPIMWYWHCAVHSKSVLDGKKLKIIVPSNIIKKNFEQSFYFSVLYKIMCNAACLEKEKINHIPHGLIYAMFLATPYVHLLYNSILSENTSMFALGLLLSLEKSIFTYYLCYHESFPNEKIFLIDKLIQYIFVCTQLYSIISQCNNKTNKCLVTGIMTCLALGYYHFNKSSLLFNLIKTKIQTMNKQSSILNDITIDVNVLSSVNINY